ncbi:MAG: 7TM-DISM domain-containing protein [Bacteroidota bacterium]
MIRLAVSCALLSPSIAEAQKSMQIDTVNKPYFFKLHYYSGKQIVAIRNVSKIDTTAFKANLIKKPVSGVSYWSTFYITIGKDVNLNYLEFDFPITNKMMIYVPVRNGGYQTYRTGMSHPVKKVTNMKETSPLLINATLIDVKRPFFLENTAFFIYGVESFHKETCIIGYDEKPTILYETYKNQHFVQFNADFESNILFGITFISFVFVFMFIFYIIHKKTYFLSYAFYLFSLMRV